MCGIVGTLRLRERVDPERLVAQRDTLVHRGPDSAGLWIAPDGRVGLAHRRLAIIDLSPGGHQPMVDPRTGAVITFNGEIYNYRALRDALAALGHEAATQSDTEVILLAYRAWGVDCLPRLQGMFAFALYDPQQHRLLLARDRAGEKPLFLWRTEGQLSFASEVKALLADPACPRRLTLDGLNAYLAYGYATGEHTLWADISQLPPGGWMTVDTRTGETASGAYWTLPQPPMSAPSAGGAADDGDLEALAARLDGVLEGAVRRQLVADVPVGILLSGGVDSSLVTAMAARVSERPVRTFTVRFPDAPHADEGPFARQVAQHFGTHHTELEAEPATPDLLRTLAAQYDTPIADSSMLPTYLVSRAIRREATVALGGDGGDELFGGYLRYPALLQQAQWRRQLPAWVRRPLARGALAFWPPTARGHGWLEALGGSAEEGLAAAGRLLRPRERQALIPRLRSAAAERVLAPERLRGTLTRDREGLVARATALDFATYMVDDVLVKVDRASMLASLEVRAPLLDAEMITFAFGAVPDAAKVSPSARKRLLRQLGRRLLPPSLDLARKQGFAIPVSDWMRGPWRPLLRPLLEDAAHPLLGALLDRDGCRRLAARLDAGAPVGEPLFALLMLGLWADAYRVSDVAG
ncbi:MAG: asparagine synthase (glutamine-hydrolyzing) [Gemmatimonadetes bacterium]|nr:asparagine synthase (glutamine-hydrolyzing) [Gemmatimonadota bacterium]